MRFGEGQVAKFCFQGVYAFTTTGLTKTVTIPFGRVESVQLTPIGASSATEGQLSANNTVSGTAGDGDAAIIGTGTGRSTDITVTRADGTLSGRKFSIFVIGY
jgi:hypothetical protein